jgi:DNA-binding NtrC family response regulator
MGPLRRVLLANPDHEAGVRWTAGLSSCGFAVDRAARGSQCLALLAHQNYDALLTELDLGDMPAEQLLEQARRLRPDIAAVVVSDQGSPRDAVRLARLGLDDYWSPSVNPEGLAPVLSQLFASRNRDAGAAEVEFAAGGARLISRSPVMRQVVETVRLIASKRSTVLVTGPTGAGKDVVARLLHALSPRAGTAMVTVNCGAIPEHLLEAEFFGHVKGAFTGAVGPRLGRFEQAHGSTLFLDEVGDLSFDLQAKVLRAVQEREFQRVGSSQTVHVDVRIIAATNCDLAAKVRRGEFREDLYYRLNVVPIRLPPLAEHLEDVPDLVRHFLKRVCREEELPPKRVAPSTMDRLLQYYWPGNVRQLENAVEKAAVLSGARLELYPSDFPLPAPEARAPAGEPEVYLPPGGLDLDAMLRRLEHSLLAQALDRTSGNKKRAAEMLGLKRTTLSAKLRAVAAGSNGL